MTDMTREEAKEILIRHNEWRRGGEGGMESPKAIGEAIDMAIKALQRVSLYNPEMTDRELSILIDAEFGKDDEEKEDSK